MTMLTNLTSSSTSPDVKVPEGCLVLASSAGEFIPWDNPDNLISRQVQTTVATAVSVFFLPLLFLVSLPTNVINMVVFWKHGVKERINLCLFCLSLADLIHMTHTFIYNVDKFYFAFTKSSGVGAVFEFIVDHKLLVFRGFYWESGFVSMLIAFERCLCVCWPLRSQTMLKTRTTLTLIVLSTVIHHGFTYVGSSRWGVACVFKPATNTTSKAIYPTSFYLQHQRVIDLVIGIVPSLLLPALYVSVVSATTVVTYVRLTQLAVWRHATSSSGAMSSREVALTRMLIGISIIYVICSTPVLVFGVVMLFVPGMSTKGRYYNTFNLILSIHELCSYINASSNFFVYCFLGSKYRETLFSLCSCCGLSKVLKLGEKGEEE